MKISATDNLKKVNDTKDLIASLKEVIEVKDLRVVISLLQMLK